MSLDEVYEESEVCLVGDDIEELNLVLERLRTALNLPILDAKDFTQNQKEV